MSAEDKATTHDCGDENCPYWERACAIRDIGAGHHRLFFVGAIGTGGVTFLGISIRRLYIGFLGTDNTFSYGVAFGAWWVND